MKPVEPDAAVQSESDGSSCATIEKCAPAQKRPRTPVAWDDPRIERVFEIRRLPKPTKPVESEKNGGENSEENDQDSDGSSLGKHQAEKRTRSWGFGKKREGKVKGDGTRKCGGSNGGGICDGDGDRPPTPTDSAEEDRYEEDEGFPEINKQGEGLKMQVSHAPREDFAELRFEHLGGPVWEILTGIEARTKFTNSELRHEGMYVASSASCCGVDVL